MREFHLIDFGKQARNAGYRAFCSKAHQQINCDACQLAMKVVPGIGVYGGVVLNRPLVVENGESRG